MISRFLMMIAAGSLILAFCQSMLFYLNGDYTDYRISDAIPILLVCFLLSFILALICMILNI